jgi:DNA-binding winged helix-turn-helix (wHTH) protein/tetratricopeptide (TPR) repeat protein
MQTGGIFQFGEFQIDARARTLRRDEEIVTLSFRAFDVLLYFVQNPGKVLTRDELLKNVWPDSFVDENSLAQSISMLRRALDEKPGDNSYIVTLTGRGYQFVAPVRVVAPENGSTLPETATAARSNSSGLIFQKHTIRTSVITEEKEQLSLPAPRNRAVAGVVSALAVAAISVAGFYAWKSRQVPPMKESDLVLVSDFVNTTGEPIFDGTLKQALTVKLEESPYFNVVLDGKTRQTLGLMGRSPAERVVLPIARDVCQREGAKVLVGGSIVRLGNKYALDLDAMNCLTGASVARQETDALNKEEVLGKLGQVIPALRRSLGESLSSIQKFDTPIEQATTKSLAALKAYTSGDEKRAQGQDAESVPSYKMAIELDPDFAIAYARLAAVYHNLQQPALGDEYLRKAFERREHVSEREKFYIQAHYYVEVTGETDKAIETYKLWTEVYPHDWIPCNNLCNEYNRIGQLDLAIAAGQQALRLNPSHSLPYAGLAHAYQFASRFAEAKAICERAKAEKLDNWIIHSILYSVAAAEGDETAMQRELNWFKGNPMESWVVMDQADNAMALGHLRRSRELFEHARSLALKQDLKEFADEITEDQAGSEADLGNVQEARKLVESSLHLVPNSTDLKASAALALARSGDVERATALAEEAARLKPLNLKLNNVTLASVRAAIELDRKNPAGAIAQLQRALPYDLSTGSAGPNGPTIYYRGLAFLELNSGKEAEAQFQRILSNPSFTGGIYWPLAHLGLARANALQARTDQGTAADAARARALTAYRDFLALWKDADPDIPILREAKAEYAKLP